MDFFKKRQFWLNRQLLLLIGQWPYQDTETSISRSILVYIIMLSTSVVQVLKIMTSERNVDLWAEIFTNQTLMVMCFLKHITCWFYRDELKMLLEQMKNNWTSLTDIEEQKIMQQTAEDGRKYNLLFTLYIYLSASSLGLVAFRSQFLNIINPLNESRPKTVPIPAEYLVDEQRYFYPIMVHLTLTATAIVTTAVACDTLYMTFLFHAAALFKIASYRMERIFDMNRDDYRNGLELKRKICRKIGAAVECHKSAVSYCDTIISAFQVSHFITTILVIINISVALYCASSIMERGLEVMTSLMLSMSQMIHFFFTSCPAQTLIDLSSAVSFDAYSGQWYNAPSETQALLVLIIRRSMRPTAIVIGKMFALSRENFATIIQTSISYFMALLSFKTV